MFVVIWDGFAGYLAEVRLGPELFVRVGHFAVDADVTGDELGIRYPQLHEQADPAKDQESDDPVPGDHRQRGTRLDQQLLRVPVEQPRGRHRWRLADA